jgi:hypothetical protein
LSEEGIDGYPDGDAPVYYMLLNEAELAGVLSLEDLNVLGLPDGEYYGKEDFAAIQGMEYTDGEIFFTVVTGTRNSDEDIGWRYGYDRSLSKVHRKDIVTGEVSLLYSY